MRRPYVCLSKGQKLKISMSADIKWAKRDGKPRGGRGFLQEGTRQGTLDACQVLQGSGSNERAAREGKKENEAHRCRGHSGEERA